MSTVLLLVLLSVGGSTVLGVFGGLLVRRIPHRFNDAVLGFAAGVMLLGALLVSVFASLLPFVLAAAGGAMLYVISDEMIPETHSHGFEKGATFALLAGFLLVMILQRLIGGVA